MINIIKNFLILSLIIIIIDSLYLFGIKDIFGNMVQSIQNERMNINIWGAVITYFFMVLSLYFFIIREKKPIIESMILGLSSYAIFDFTNYALFNNWNLYIGIIDTLWGGILYGLTTFIYYNIV